jgi:hypothetical protein
LPDGIRLVRQAQLFVELVEDEERQLTLTVAAKKNSLQRIGKLHRLPATLVFKDVLGKQRKLPPISFPVTVGLAVIEETVQTKERLGASVITKEAARLPRHHSPLRSTVHQKGRSQEPGRAAGF